MIPHLTTVEHEIKKVIYNIEIEILTDPTGDDVTCEVYLYKIISSERKCFTYKVRLTGRARASVSHGLKNMDIKIKKGLQETYKHIAKGSYYDLILTYTTNGWLMIKSDVQLAKHSKCY